MPLGQSRPPLTTIETKNQRRRTSTSTAHPHVTLLAAGPVGIMAKCVWEGHGELELGRGQESNPPRCGLGPRPGLGSRPLIIEAGKRKGCQKFSGFSSGPLLPRPSPTHTQGVCTHASKLQRIRLRVH